MATVTVEPRTPKEGEPEKDNAYEYLCRLEEAKKWLESMLSELLPPATELEDVLQNGVLLCKLGMKLLPEDPMWKKVYDLNQAKFKSKGLDYRHTDNINFWLGSLQKLGLPKVFYPVMTDIFHKKNMPKLIYCLHALSHLLKKQGRSTHAVDDLYGTAKFSQDALAQTSKTLQTRDLPAFGVVENLVEEELQYQAIGITDSFDEDAERLFSPTEVSPDAVLPSPLFDDPKYITTGKAQEFTHTREGLVARTPCQQEGIRASFYSRKEPQKNETDQALSAVEQAIQVVNEALDHGNPQETLKALQNPKANLPFTYLDPDKYFSALLEERVQGIPCNVLPVFSGIDRKMCEFLLEKMSPGAYIVRDSRTLQGVYVFSFRNQTGIKHWRLNTKNGRFCWGTSPLFDTLDAFVEHFVEALTQVTKLHIYPGMSAALQPVLQNSEQKTVVDSLRQKDTRLTYGQICQVIKNVNSEIRQGRKLSFSDQMQSKPAANSWDKAMVISVNRIEAEQVLNKEGQPGSFLMRPSEKTLGDYALAFRTAKEVRHWKITQDTNKFYVHPRPNPYNSLEDIVQHFREAVGLETGLTMTPLVHPYEQPQKTVQQKTEQQKDAVAPLDNLLSPKRVSTKSSTIGRTATPSASLSKLNPANLTSWSVDDVCQWLNEQGLGRFMDIFRENAVDGECLLTLDNELLKTDLGITALGHRSRILKRVRSLKGSVHPGLH